MPDTWCRDAMNCVSTGGIVFICVDSRHLRNLRSDIADTTQKKGEHKVRPYTAYHTLFADG